MENYKQEALERMARFIGEGLNGCTTWSGGRDQEGYPLFWWQGATKRASRVLWELLYGEIPSDMVIRHTCDNPECLRSGHLLLGTNKENTGDALQRGRMVGPRKVTKEIEAEIVRLRQKERWKVWKIAKHFNISQSSVKFYIRKSVENV